MALKKGSAAAKAFMAKLRAAKGKRKVGAHSKVLKYKGFDIETLNLATGGKEYLVKQISPATNREVNYGIYNTLTNAKKWINSTLKLKQKFIGSFQSVYNKAPMDVKKIIDKIDDNADYRVLTSAQKALSKKGYFIDYDLNGSIINFKKIPSGKVGYKKDRTAVLRASTKFIPAYRAKGYTRKESVDAATYDAANLIQMSQLKGTNKQPISKMHKDTKSHNVNIRVLSGTDSIDFTRVNNDVNGNPRYVVHFLDILNAEERLTIPFVKKYEYAIKKGKALGGKKYSNKSYGGGIAFQSYNIENLEKKLIDLKHTTPKIKY